MIESITISGVASFKQEPQILSGFSQFNYLFGSNGTGKTTISRVIADESAFPSCQVTWKGGTKLEAMVYNHDFVELNFHQAAELKGVFTLGKQQKETLDKITIAKNEEGELIKRIENLTQSLQGENGSGGKHGELEALEISFKEKTWISKQKFDNKNVQSAFKGHMGSKEAFKSKVLQEAEANFTPLLTLAELENKAASIFGQTPVQESLVPDINSASLLVHESNQILKKRVIGKEDIDIAAMIKKLGNSDWVRAGRPFYDSNDKTCPFCQQKTSDAFATSLNDYFDEAFILDSKAINDLATNYAADAQRIQQQVSSIVASPSRFLDVEKLKSQKEILDTRINLNNQYTNEKKRESSQVVTLESLANVSSEIKKLIDEANQKISKHNKMVSNLNAERKTLASQVWRFVLEELKLDIDKYRKNKDNLTKTISSLEDQIKKAKDEKTRKQAEIRSLEKQTTSVQPTVDAINALLLSFGFQNFKLVNSESDTSYKLLRQDGSDAKTTLSEGEKTFITFLYFYHLLKGSISESGATMNRVVVFDDPVSSLDSEILFIVSSLIKQLYDDMRNENGYIKQLFILTHNVYFHKEITYNSKRTSKAMREETFWIVRKANTSSLIEKCDTNPITTSYDLLWAEIRRSDKSKLTVQNTLRRILENYFKILGGIDLHQLCENFDGKEKIICKALISWINDGSHFVNDDLYVALDDTQIDACLKVFEDIFKKSGHHAHYRMMMGITPEESVPT
jgi:wobble nucleotide-excising tRNase